MRVPLDHIPAHHEELGEVPRDVRSVPRSRLEPCE